MWSFDPLTRKIGTTLERWAASRETRKRAEPPESTMRNPAAYLVLLDTSKQGRA